MAYALYIRRGRLINDDPQKRCYNGCYFKSHMEWSEWELWLKDSTYPTKEQADHVARLFTREDQQFKSVEV